MSYSKLALNQAICSGSNTSQKDDSHNPFVLGLSFPTGLCSYTRLDGLRHVKSQVLLLTSSVATLSAWTVGLQNSEASTEASQKHPKIPQ